MNAIDRFIADNEMIYCEQRKCKLTPKSCANVSSTSRKGMQMGAHLDSLHPCRGCKKVLPQIKRMVFRVPTAADKARRAKYNTSYISEGRWV